MFPLIYLLSYDVRILSLPAHHVHYFTNKRDTLTHTSTHDNDPGPVSLGSAISRLIDDYPCPPFHTSTHTHSHTVLFISDDFDYFLFLEIVNVSVCVVDDF